MGYIHIYIMNKSCNRIHNFHKTYFGSLAHKEFYEDLTTIKCENLPYVWMDTCIHTSINK